MQYEEKRREWELEQAKELELVRLNLEREKLELNTWTEREKIETERRQIEVNLRKEEESAIIVKKYADVVKNVLPRQPSDNIEIVSFFKNVEHIFQEFKIPDDFWSALIRPYLKATDLR